MSQSDSRRTRRKCFFNSNSKNVWPNTAAAKLRCLMTGLNQTWDRRDRELNPDLKSVDHSRLIRGQKHKSEKLHMTRISVRKSVVLESHPTIWTKLAKIFP